MGVLRALRLWHRLAVAERRIERLSRSTGTLAVRERIAVPDPTSLEAEIVSSMRSGLLDWVRPITRRRRRRAAGGLPDALCHDLSLLVEADAQIALLEARYKALVLLDRKGHRSVAALSERRHELESLASRLLADHGASLARDRRPHMDDRLVHPALKLVSGGPSDRARTSASRTPPSRKDA